MDLNSEKKFRAQTHKFTEAGKKSVGYYTDKTTL